MLGALAATVAAWAVGRRGRFVTAALLLVVAGVLLRANLADRHWLSDWDERYHAVVGRNALDDPLHPSVVPHPLFEPHLHNWGRARVWLHKPPLATWLIAASLATFGENEVAVRVPSLIFAGLGIFLTFLIGWRLLGAPVGLVAAGIHAWHARFAQLAAGLRATDHVDHQFIALVALGVWLALAASDAFAGGDGSGPRRARGWWLTASCGLATGLALLTKSSPALVVIGVFGLALLVRPVGWAVRLAAPGAALVLAWLVQLPWKAYTERTFPEHAAYYRGRNARYFLEVEAGQMGPPWFYVSDMADIFGWLAPVAVGLFLVRLRGRRELWPIFGWLLVTYGVFSLAATKMTAYVMIAAPVVMLAMAWVWVEAWSDRPAGRARLAWRSLAVLLAVGFVMSSIGRVHRPWRHPERHALWADELRYLGDRIDALGPGPWVVFNTPSLEEARFYTRATVARHPPTARDLARARELGFRVAVYGRPAVPIRETEGITFIPNDPRAEAQREILRQLPHAPFGTEIWLWNARDPKRLEEFLERTVKVDVRERVPDAADLARVERNHGVTAILVAPGEPDPPLPEGAHWIRVESEAFAHPAGGAP